MARALAWAYQTRMDSSMTWRMGVVWCGVVWCDVVWCAEGAVTRRQWLGCLPTGTRKREGCVCSVRAVCKCVDIGGKQGKGRLDRILVHTSPHRIPLRNQTSCQTINTVSGTEQGELPPKKRKLGTVQDCQRSSIKTLIACKLIRAETFLIEIMHPHNDLHIGNGLPGCFGKCGGTLLNGVYFSFTQTTTRQCLAVALGKVTNIPQRGIFSQIWDTKLPHHTVSGKYLLLHDDQPAGLFC